MSPTSSTEQFYHNLPTIDRFENAIDTGGHNPLPADWWVVVTDVVGSTKAIEQGAYKDVNSIGVLTIVAAINVNRAIEIPYIFGGDGSVCAIPPSMKAGVRIALLTCKDIANTSFGLELRCGMVRVGELQETGHLVNIGKTRSSRAIVHAILSGRGWEMAETLVKNPETRSRYEVTKLEGEVYNANLSGYECRWQDVEPEKQCCLCILVQALHPDSAERLKVYRGVLSKIAVIFGAENRSNPISDRRLHLNFMPQQVWRETNIHAAKKGFLAKLGQTLWCYKQIILGYFLMLFKIKISGVDWSQYKLDVSQNTDVRKFDGTLKAVVDAMESEVEIFRRYLENEHQSQRLAFGLHRSAVSLITCMVHSYQDNHMHFIDGSDGGYAFAAKELKQQILAFKSASGVPAK